MIRAVVLACVVALAGCTGRAAEVYDRPPAAREEIAEARPGFVWIRGRWARDDGRWSWQPGHYEPERPGFAYVQGRWEKRGEYYVWIDGAWRALASR